MEQEEEKKKEEESRRCREEEEAAARRAEEQQAKEREEAERAEMERAAEEERSCQEELATFLAAHKFKGVAAAKKSLLKTTYALHCAAELGNERVVEGLLSARAEPGQKDSKGKTAVQIAQRKDRQGSHAAVLRVLGGA